MGIGSFEHRGVARFKNKQQSTWRKGIQWHVGDRVSKKTWRMLPSPCGRPNSKVSEPNKTQVFGTITGFESNQKNRPSVKWDEQPEPFSTPHHSLQEWHEIAKA